jgi:DNA-directed RNA polymerase subunit delta
MVKEGMSLVDIASIILTEKKEPINLYDLFDEVLKRKNIEVEDKAVLLSRFYADLTVSAKFVYTGENMWDLKVNQKIELWEKDGSFFKEYTKIDIPAEYLEEPTPKPERKAKVVEVVEEEVVEAVVEEIIEEVVKAPKKEEAIKKDETVVPVAAEYDEFATDEFEEELFEDDDFDEEKYNEYMDNYEDQYDN